MISLVLEDSPTCAAAIWRTLEALGYQCEFARTIRAARARCHQRAFDMYIIDVNVPETGHTDRGNGLGFVEWLRGIQATPPIIVCSADENNRVIAERIGLPFVLKTKNLAVDLRAAIERMR